MDAAPVGEQNTETPSTNVHPSGRLWELDYCQTPHQRATLFLRCETWCLWLFARVVSK